MGKDDEQQQRGQSHQDNSTVIMAIQSIMKVATMIAKKHRLSLKNHYERFPQRRNRRRPCKHSCQRLHLFLVLTLICLSSRLLKANTAVGNGVFSICLQNLFSSAFIPARNIQRLHSLTNEYPERNVYFSGTSRNQNVVGEMQPVRTNPGTQRQILYYNQQIHQRSNSRQPGQLFVAKESDEKVEIGEGGNDDSTKIKAIVKGSEEVQLVENSSQMNKKDDDSGLDPILILPIATIVAILLLCLVVLYTQLTNPVVDFDVDFYMALDAMRDVGVGGDASDADTIMGLPKLSPAEQLVGALFGPH